MRNQKNKNWWNGRLLTLWRWKEKGKVRKVVFSASRLGHPTSRHPSGCANTMAPHLQPYDRGPTRESCGSSVHQGVSDSTTLIPSCRPSDVMELVNNTKPKKNVLYTPESPRHNSVKISGDKLTNSKKRTRDTELSQTSDQVSTSRGPVCVPFWNQRIKEISHKLLSSTEIAWRDSPLTSWSSFSKDKALKSWYTAKTKVPNPHSSSPKTLWQSQQSLWQAITVNEQLKEDADASENEKKKKRKLANSKAKKVYRLPRTRQFRIRPNEKLRGIINNWQDHARRAYNICISVFKEYHSGVEETVYDVDRLAKYPVMDKKKRPVIRIVDGKLNIPVKGRENAIMLIAATREKGGDIKRLPYGKQPPKPKWLTTPQEIRSNSMLDAKKAIASVEAKNGERAIRGEMYIKSTFKFRSRRDGAKSISFSSRTYNQTSGVIINLIKACKVRKGRGLPLKAKHAVRLCVDRERKVTLCFVDEFEVKDEKEAPDHVDSFHSVASLDPGIRTFQSIFDADGNAIEWGAGGSEQLMYHCRRADNLRSKIDKQKDKHKRWYLKRAYYRTLRKLKNKVNECQYKLALFLCENYRVVLIPKFEVSRMVKKSERKIGNKTVRPMYTWSHYKFRQRLLEKAKEHPWCRVIEVDEAFTSKTCDECGYIRENFKGKTFECPSCGHKADRDIHAGKNILLRYISREGLNIS